MPCGTGTNDFRQSKKSGMKNIPILEIAIIILFVALLRSCACRNTNECNMRDYQLDITDTGTHIYRGKTEIGFVPFDSTSQYDKLFLKDNL